MSVENLLKHAVGHNKALARTIPSQHTSLFLAGDSFDHPSELRPSPAVLLPKELDLPAFGAKISPLQIFQNLKPNRQLDRPFVELSDSFSVNSEQAVETTINMQPIDVDEECFVVAADDKSIEPMDYSCNKQTHGIRRAVSRRDGGRS